MRHPLSRQLVDPAVARVVCQLIAMLRERPPPAGDLLLDVEVGDVRCRLTLIAAPEGDSAGGRDSSGGRRKAAPALSPREHQIACMVARGQTNQAIADVLGISAWTVSTHIRRIFAKLGVNSRAAMVAGVLGNGRWPGIELPEEATSRAAGSPVAFR